MSKVDLLVNLGGRLVIIQAILVQPGSALPPSLCSGLISSLETFPQYLPDLQEGVMANGASTGGVEALRHVIGRLPPSAPGILISQHMPPGFTVSFARRMNDQCAVTVTEATDGAPIRRGHVYIAPGSRHLEIRQRGKEYVCRLHDDAPISGHRPSVDVLFRSVTEVVGADSLGIILTGMGRDGASGLLAMRQRGARTLGQSEASCVIYGMPRVAKEFGAVESEMSLDRIAEEIVRMPARSRAAAAH